MAGYAPYEVIVSGTDDETFVFSIPWENNDGTPFPFSSYAIEYSVPGWFSLTQASGITVSGNEVVFQAPQARLRPGSYDHGCRVKEIASGRYFSVFDGKINISEGNFR